MILRIQIKLVFLFCLHIFCSEVNAADEELKFSYGTYYGEVSGGVRHGNGVFYWNNGGTFEGKWVFGTRHGHGTYTSKTGKTTPVYYQYDKLSVDYLTLPEGYTTQVCSFLTNIFSTDVDNYFFHSYDLLNEQPIQIVKINYKQNQNFGSPILTAKCKFTFNEKHKYYQLIDAKIEDIDWTEKVAKEMGEVAISSLFLPTFEE